MALVECYECKTEISEHASSCPKCGFRGKPKTKFNWGALIMTGIAFAWFFSGGDSVVSTLIDPPKPPDNSCTANWRNCLDNTDLANHYMRFIDIQSACKQEMEKRVTYGTPVWHWEAFSKFTPGNFRLDNQITLIDDDVQLENEYGAKIHSSVMCRYDLVGNRVLTVLASAN